MECLLIEEHNTEKRTKSFEKFHNPTTTDMFRNHMTKHDMSNIPLMYNNDSSTTVWSKCDIGNFIWNQIC